MSIDYRRLREKIRIEELLGWIGWEAARRKGDQLRGACPLCAQYPLNSSPAGELRHDCSFSVNTQHNIFRCFRCGYSGNALDLWAKLHGLSIYQAATEIQNRLAATHHGPQNTQPPEPN